jgi:hypothetical protein
MSNGKIIGELERIWKELAVAEMRYYAGISGRGLIKSRETTVGIGVVVQDSH